MSTLTVQRVEEKGGGEGMGQLRQQGEEEEEEEEIVKSHPSLFPPLMRPCSCIHLRRRRRSAQVRTGVSHLPSFRGGGGGDRHESLSSKNAEGENISLSKEISDVWQCEYLISFPSPSLPPLFAIAVSHISAVGIFFVESFSNDDKRVMALCEMFLDLGLDLESQSGGMKWVFFSGKENSPL